MDTGQSPPKITRPKPKQSTTWSIYGCRSAGVQFAQSASVTRPDSLHQTFGNFASSRSSARHGSSSKALMSGLAMWSMMNFTFGHCFTSFSVFASCLWLMQRSKLSPWRGSSCTPRTKPGFRQNSWSASNWMMRRMPLISGFAASRARSASAASPFSSGAHGTMPRMRGSTRATSVTQSASSWNSAKSASHCRNTIFATCTGPQAWRYSSIRWSRLSIGTFTSHG